MPVVDGRDMHTLVTAVRQLRHDNPHADPHLVVRVAIDTRDGLAAFGYRDDECTATLITEIAATDPRLHIGNAQ